MPDVPRIEGTPDPRQTGSVKKDSSIDSEKFKKILKVDESEETEQRRKRNLAKSEEDSDEEVEKVEESKTPETLFSDYMASQKPTTSVFDIQGGKKQGLGSSSTDGEMSPYNMVAEGPGYAPSTPPTSEVSSSFDEPSVEGELSMSTTSSNQNQDSPSAKSDTNPEPDKKGFLVEFSKKEVPKPIKAPPSLQASPQPKPVKLQKTKAPSTTQPLKAEKKAPESPIPPQKPTVLAVKEKEKENEKEGIKEAPPPIIEIKKEPLVVQKETIADELSTMKNNRPSGLITHEGEKDKKRKREDEAGQTASVQSDTPLSFGGVAIPSAAPPPYTRFNPQLFEFFERMVGLITVEQTKGVSTTTVTLRMPGSVFNGCQIKLDHYDTAPHSFNVQLLGNSDAVDTFSARLADLVAAFRYGNYAFEINILKPELLNKERPRPLVRRKAKAGDQEKNPSDS